MPDPKVRFDELITALRERDFRLTPQRVELVRLIAAMRFHPLFYPDVGIVADRQTVQVVMVVDQDRWVRRQLDDRIQPQGQLRLDEFAVAGVIGF